jgi:hypothetical protein
MRGRPWAETGTETGRNQLADMLVRTAYFSVVRTDRYRL